MIARDHAITAVIHSSPGIPWPTRVATALVRVWQAWRKRERQRVQVARMSERDAADFGMTKQQLAFELERPLAKAIRWL